MTYYDYEFFLEFSSKEEYLQKRSLWRETYKNLSLEIRHNKNVNKEYFRAKARVINSLGLNTRYWYQWEDHQRRSYHELLKEECDKIPASKKEYTGFYDATEMLEIRHQQKELSKEQREKALMEYLSTPFLYD
jgi:hypothetical protein